MTLKTYLPLFISAALIAPSAFGAEPQPAPQSTGLPVTLSLEKSGYVTAVSQRADGRGVGNLASEVKAQAGLLTPPWKTEDTSVTWMGDHAALSDVLYLARGPDGPPAMVLATSCAECDPAMCYANLGGKKFKGINSDNFNGAKAITRLVLHGSGAVRPRAVLTISSSAETDTDVAERQSVVSATHYTSG